MKNKIDFQFLKKALILFTIALFIATAFVFAGEQYKSQRLADYNAKKASLSQSHRQYKKLVKDIDLIQQYTQAYKGFKKSGLIGSERRLSWIETLEKVNDELKLPKLSYKLLPQEQFKRAILPVDPKIKVNSTPMELNIELLHEEDVFAVYDGLKNNIDNLFTVESCKITRLKANSPLSTKRANLRSTCLLRWITVNVQS